MSNVVSASAKHMTTETFFIYFLEELEEIILAWGAKGELNKLTATLKTIQVVLLDAEEKQSSDRRISHWLGKLKDVCNDVDDVLDEFEFQKLWISSGASSIKGKVRQFFSEWNSLIFNFKLAHKIKEVRGSLEVIAIEKTHYSLAEREGDHWRGLNNNDISERETDSIVVESNVVGRYEDQENVILRLLNEDKGVASHHFMDLGNVCVISIIGLAGFGKTTLAKLVYNDKRVAQNFGMRMWICASNHFDNIRLIRGMISAATNQKCDQYQSLDLMKRGLQEALRGKKFLLVLDDICDNESGGVTWKDMKPLLNVCDKGSKILITTSNKSVSLHIGSIYVHQLNALSHSDSMSLFYLSGEEAEAQVPESKLRFDKLRTFVTLDGEGSRITISKYFLRSCISRSKCMRALNLQGLALEEIPSSIGNLSHLRYLNMSGNKMIRKLPSSIYKLMKLQFLYLGGCEALEELPKEIGNLINLRYLELTTQELYLPKGIFRLLNNLQKLSIANCSKLSALPEFTAYELREKMHSGFWCRLAQDRTCPQGGNRWCEVDDEQ